MDDAVESAFPETVPPRMPRLLVVDDTPDSLYLMARLFEGRFEVLQAGSGREALALAASAPDLDLVLLDIVMPDMDGYEVLRRLRQQPATAGIPVAFLTSLDGEDQQRLGRDLGAVDYLTKPVDPLEVVRRVEGHAREVRQARHLEALGERLSRHLSPTAWHQLFHGAGAATIGFSCQAATLLVVDAAPLNGEAAARQAFLDGLADLAAAGGGALDAYGRTEAALLFDHPLAALRTALALQARPEGREARLGLHHAPCVVARFRGLGAWERTLLGGEARQARVATAGAGPGVLVLSAPAYALLRDEIQARPDAGLLTGKFLGDGLAQAWLAPVPPAGPGARPRWRDTAAGLPAAVTP
ncbi:response regulator [Ramlibacter sp. MAHUQ-53]|uniref:response regulator n=1 Tax=unclassified Ramlibacter TaxID=2617605 RepID=UPI00363F8D9E